MAGNTFGVLFTVTSFGESHGPAIGCVVDGCPPGMSLVEADIQKELDRRKPGSSRFVTQRREPDAVQILSGVYQGKTTGAPIALVIHNSDSRSRDYDKLEKLFRPGHADYTYWYKYGIRDPRGGGRSSARETAVRVAAGAIAKKWLAERCGVIIRGHLAQLGEKSIPFTSWEAVDKNPFFAADLASIPELEAYLQHVRKRRDSVGARVRIVAHHVPVGWGEPVYGRLDAEIAYAMMSINAVKGVEIGAGFAAVSHYGSQHGDELTPDGFLSNHSGGILGGISSGQDIEVSIALKPTPSIATPRRTVDQEGRAVVIETHGRHDPCVGLRATPIGEAMLAIVLMDQALRHRAQCADVKVIPPWCDSSAQSTPKE